MNKSKVLMALVWLGLLGVTTWMFDAALDPNRLEGVGNAMVVELERDPSGHYRADVLINGIKVPAMIDTGATGVAISEQIANRLGLRSRTAIMANTANGISTGYATRLESVRLGSIEARDVGAAIVPGLGEEVLLGMSFLSRMDIRLYRGKMTIKQTEDL